MCIDVTTRRRKLNPVKIARAMLRPTPVIRVAESTTIG
jgi:hypothetical protein